MKYWPLLFVMFAQELKGPVLFQEIPVDTIQRQIELWRIEHADDQDRRCMPGHPWDRCHNISVRI